MFLVVVCVRGFCFVWTISLHSTGTYHGHQAALELSETPWSPPAEATTLNNRRRFGISFSVKILLCLSVVVLNPGSSCWTFLSVSFTNTPPRPELYLALHLDLLVDSFLVREVFPVTRVHLTWLQEEMRNSEGRAENTKFCPSFIYALPCNLAQFFPFYSACSPFWWLRRHPPVT